jgi:hypothetical protein
MRIEATAEVSLTGRRLLLQGYSRSPKGWWVGSPPYANLLAAATDEEIGLALQHVLSAPREPVGEPTLANAPERVNAAIEGLGISRTAYLKARGVSVDTDFNEVRVAITAPAKAGVEGEHDSGAYVWARFADAAALGRAVREALSKST